MALVQHRLVTSTPHLGASTVEAQSRVAVEVAQNFVDLANQSALNGAVSMIGYRFEKNLTFGLLCKLTGKSRIF